MKPRPNYRLPEEKQEKFRKVVRLEWTTIFFLLTITVVMYLSMGGSQAMRTAWIEDILSLIPPIAILIAFRYRDKEPNERFPYGYRRAATIAFLCSAFALTILALYMIYDAALSLIRLEHPTIGMVELFGVRLWMGWVMIAALVYSALPPVVLGRMKLPLAEELHEKGLHTDADMNKADWMTATAASFGILGIGIGWWWADAVAALFISLEVLHDGVSNVKKVFQDLMDRRPMKVDRNEPDLIPEMVRRRIERLPWVEVADVRLREEGHVLSGEAFVVPRDETDLIDRLQEARKEGLETNWRVYDLVVTAVRSLDDGRGR